MRFNASKFNEHWEDKVLNDLGAFNRGKSRHRPRNDPALFDDGKYPLIQTGEIKAANLFINRHTDTYNDFGLAQSKIWPKDTLCITIAANIAETALLASMLVQPVTLGWIDPDDSAQIIKALHKVGLPEVAGQFAEEVVKAHLLRRNFSPVS